MRTGGAGSRAGPQAGPTARPQRDAGPASKRSKLSVRVPPRAQQAAQGDGGGWAASEALCFTPSELQLFQEVNALLTPSLGAEWDALSLDGSGASARAGGGAARGSGGATAGGSASLETPLPDMASVFSWFLNSPSGAPGGGLTVGGPAAAPAAAAAVVPPTARSIASMIRMLSPAASPSGTPRSRASARGAAAAAAAAASSRLPDGGVGLTAEQGQKALLHKLLHLRACGGTPSGQPSTPLSPGFFDALFSPLGGSRRSPRFTRTGDETARSVGVDGGATPAFSSQEMQLLLATLGGAWRACPCFPGVCLLLTPHLDHRGEPLCAASFLLSAPRAMHSPFGRCRAGRLVRRT